ncbi:MAG TPA: phosphotransferase [Chthoniobacterales bacterium]
MINGSIVSATRRQFPHFTNQALEVIPLEKGGSDRKFHRIRTGEASMIFIQYSDSREENSHYVEIARFLRSQGLRVPEVYHHDAKSKIIWMQDLGEVDLWHFRQQPWPVRRPHYLSTLEQAARLHTTATAARPGAPIQLQPAFDEALYRWEQAYFFENCLQLALGFAEAEARRQAENPAFARIAARLAGRAPTLVHRDFQSQNIMICQDQAWLIDFQGMRPGLPQYDLASLLYDPYVTLTGEERRDLLAAYQAFAGVGAGPDFEEIFDLCALQRLMQALGAYGFLGLKRGKPHFLNHIPAAKKSLAEVAARIAGLGDFVALLRQS